jgi:hypothetical protein
MTPLLAHPLWPLIRPWVKIQTYDRDGGHADPRHRIELDAPDNDAFRAVVLAVTVPCVACGAVIHPIRSRAADTHGNLYIAVTCPLNVRMGCARGGAASDAYDQIVAAALGDGLLI